MHQLQFRVALLFTVLLAPSVQLPAAQPFRIYSHLHDTSLGQGAWVWEPSWGAARRIWNSAAATGPVLTAAAAGGGCGFRVCMCTHQPHIPSVPPM